MFISCLEEPECTSTDSEWIELSFHSVSDGKGLSVFVDSIYSESHTGNFLKNKTLSSVFLPFAPNFQQMSFIVQNEYGRDTIRVDYSYIPRLFGAQCEVELIFENIELNSSSFDSIQFKSIPAHAKVYY